MAKNYTMTEAATILAAGTDLNAIAELGKRFPILTAKVTKVAALAGDDFVDLMGYMPEHLTANKVNNLMKAAISGVDEDTEEEEDVTDETPVEKPAKKTKKAAKVEEDEEEATGYEAMTSKELKAECRKRKIFADLEDHTKAGMIAALKANDNGATTAAAEEDDEADEEDNELASKSVKELFAMCKKAGLAVKPKQPKEVYIEALQSADEEDEDDDWGDEEEEAPAPAPKKTSKKAKAEESVKAEKKPAKKAEPVEEEDDDDDWDI